MISSLSSNIWFEIEHRLAPGQKNWDYISVVALLPMGLTILPLHLIEFFLLQVGSWFSSYTNPNEDFSTVLKDSREWKKIDNLAIKNPSKNFLYGAATCTYQDSGAEHCPNSQWAVREKQLAHGSGKSANLFELYQTDPSAITDRLHKLGMNSYRFSIEWSQIEPEEGTFNEAALQVYINFCKHLRKERISPMVTLHHFSEPNWFHQKGSFENEENIDHFVKFAKKVFTPLSKDRLVKHFCTINEPNIEAFSRYIYGSFSPQCKLNFSRGAQFLKGALKAHQAVYTTLKQINSEAKIGIVHQYLEFEASNPLVYPVCRYFNRILNEVTFNYFKTGIFDCKIPFLCNVFERGNKPKTDFVGLQNYVRPLIGFTGSTSYHEPMTKMPFREDPESLYNAIVKTYDAFEEPIIVTENGISTDDDEQRARYLKRALYATLRAAKSVPVLGYYLWSFCDNFEWDMGWKQTFGAYALNNGQLAEKPKFGIPKFPIAI